MLASSVLSAKFAAPTVMDPLLVEPLVPLLFPPLLPQAVAATATAERSTAAFNVVRFTGAPAFCVPLPRRAATRVWAGRSPQLPDNPTGKSQSAQGSVTGSLCSASGRCRTPGADLFHWCLRRGVAGGREGALHPRQPELGEH